MGYTNVFTKLDQDISNQIKTLQAKQQELIEKKKNLLATKQKIQGFLTDAQEIKKILGSDPELINSIKLELDKIFQSENKPQSTPKKEAHLLLNIENSPLETIEKPPEKKEPELSINLESGEEESIKIFKFIDTQGKNTSF